MDGSQECVEKVLDEISDDIKDLKTGKPRIHYKIKTRELKRATKHILTGQLQVGSKTYRVKQSHYIYNKEIPAVDDDPSLLRKEWFVSCSQMKSIIANNDLWLNHRTTFDGMTDGTEYLHDGYVKPTEHQLEYIIKQLSRRGLFRCWYNSEDGVFHLYSCVDDYEVYIEGVDFL